jgi:NADH dehydrogenase [ubiquinone] 1 alpha subcomplex assembly factor 7
MDGVSASSQSWVKTVLPEENHLAKRLAKQIENSGPISVAEFMRAANAEYYSRADPLGAEGDFITAPEISQMFGELIGLWLTDLWMRQNRPDRCHYVELGPGRGTLAADALRSMAQFDFRPDVHFVETSDLLRGKQSQAVPQAQFCDLIDELPDDGPLFVIANEFFDALPIRQMVSTYAGWRERVVARDKGTKFMVMPGTQPLDHLVPEDFRNAPTHTIYETSPEATGFMYELVARLAKQGGLLLIIDYGYSLPGLGSTLQAVKDHQFVDPFEDPGAHDLTAHVNFLELSNLARMRDLKIRGPIEQGGWLSAIGINQRANSLADANPERLGEIEAARNRLVNGDQMGILFKVMAVTSPDWPDPEGFQAGIE